MEFLAVSYHHLRSQKSKPLSEPLAQGFAQGRINFDERPQREGAAICGKATGVTKLSGGVVGRNLSGWYR